MRKFIVKFLDLSWRWVHRDVFDYQEDTWCIKFASILEIPKNYDWVEIEKRKLRNSNEIVDWYLYKTYKHKRLDDNLRRFFNLACMNYVKGNNKVNVFWQNLCCKFEYFNVKWREIKELEKPGNVVMIRSHFHHKVTPVTSGERRTLTHFMVGPRFI